MAALLRSWLSKLAFVSGNEKQKINKQSKFAIFAYSVSNVFCSKGSVETSCD